MSQVTSIGAVQAGQDPDAPAWGALASAGTDEAFCRAWLALQCAAVPRVRAGLLLLREAGGEAFVPAAVWPDEHRDVNHLTPAAERALRERRGTVINAEAEDGVHVAYPVEIAGQAAGAVVLDLGARPEAQLQAVLRQLLWGAGWLEALLRRRAAGADARRVERAAACLDLLQAAQQQRTLGAAAMAIANELATRCQAQRVSMGVLRGTQLRLRALSRTAWFDPRSQLAEALECAMEESIEQNGAIALPAVRGRRALIHVAQRDLVARSGAAAVLSVPLISRGHPVGALTLERAAPFDEETILFCELAGELLGPPLEELGERERWLAGRLPQTAAGLARKLAGPRHPTLKLGALALLCAVLFLGFGDGQFRVAARSGIEGSVQRAVVAPFEGYVAEAPARAGYRVTAGQLLARLDDRDIELDRRRWAAERESSERRYRDALGKHDRVGARVLAAQLERAEAQLALAEEKVARARLTAPFDGVVVSGDLSQLLGAPVEQGKVLYEVAPLDAYRLILKVDERDIAHVAAGQRGELALTGLSGAALGFTVKNVTSVASAEDGRNFFRVEAALDAAALDEAQRGLRPGMEGVAKIDAGERRLAWIWTRHFVNWARLAFWSWLP